MWQELNGWSTIASTAASAEAIVEKSETVCKAVLPVVMPRLWQATKPSAVTSQPAESKEPVCRRKSKAELFGALLQTKRSTVIVQPPSVDLKDRVRRKSKAELFRAAAQAPVVRAPARALVAPLPCATAAAPTQSCCHCRSISHSNSNSAPRRIMLHCQSLNQPLQSPIGRSSLHQ